MVAAVALLMASGVSSTGCGGSAEQRARELRDTAGSWAAALRVSTDEWSRGVVPAHFVASMAAVARSELTRDAERIRSTLGAGASAPADQVLAALPALTSAVEAGNRPTAVAVAQEIAAKVPAKPTPAVARPQ
jgi:hypothetical protein